MIESLRPNSEVGFWKSPDIHIQQGVVINPGASSVVIGVIDARTIDFIQKTKLKSQIKPTLRSRYAHLGLDIHLDDRAHAINEFLETGSDVLNFRAENHSLRPVSISNETPLLRLFNDSPQDLITGLDLVRAVDTRLIHLRGEKGRDWEFGYSDIGEISSIFLRLNPDFRKTIAMDPQNDPIEIDGNGSDFRSKIDHLYVPVPVDEHIKWWLGETAVELSLEREVEGVLDTRVLNSLRNPYNDLESFQTNSQLIDNSSDHRIRVEIVSPTSGQIPNYVKMHFLKNGTSKY